ncbi:hypothetical protein Ana3638_05900 [Anaerocolumna sedimenticola]|uniref:DUF6128 domain-containing protein n=1 Tax=Anaerocolumna sedimenticola TaxID=2696063 RepID=A0A6P1TJT6_9FIRM|nr:DUF6128 domain-containing protein [Anaerocolumna sedimenticola]QHQ60362.1 hypothetical protein Ana3638_05900 [Anaerocolumna sedimenticola]
MPDYKRLVSYMYNYDDGIKKNNVGYARVEARNGQCKCTLHIAAPSLNDKQLKVYIFKRRKDGLEGILLGTLQVKNGAGDYKTVTDSVHIMNSSYGLDDMGGIVLYLTERKYFATSWDDAPITMELVAGIESTKYEKELQAAAVYVTRLDQLTKSAENQKEAVTVKEQEDKKDSEDFVKQVKQEEIIEESPNNEGEVFNDFADGKAEQTELNTEIKQKEPAEKEVAVKEVSREESQKDNQKENKDDLKNEKEEENNIVDELNAPVEILQKEEMLTEDTKGQIEESNSSDDNTDNKQDGFTYDSFGQDPFTDNLNVNGLNEFLETEQFNTGESTAFDNFDLQNNDLQSSESQNADLQREDFQNILETQTIAEDIQSDIQGEEYQKDGERQPFFEDHPLAKRIYRSFPRMYPFEDNEIAWCVRIEPQNIGMFPMEAWILGNNSFLLHGYYSYRHLIFARMNDKNGFSYILGVPGIYHNREKFMAKMFGFENFKCVKRKAQRTGEFGYWYIPITLT